VADVKATAEEVVWAGANLAFSLPGFTPAFDKSTVGSVDPHHRCDQSSKKRQTDKKNQSGCHDV
jgi:hypothetical protein